MPDLLRAELQRPDASDEARMRAMLGKAELLLWTGAEPRRVLQRYKDALPSHAPIALWSVARAELETLARLAIRRGRQGR